MTVGPLYTLVAELGKNLTHFASGKFRSDILHSVFLLSNEFVILTSWSLQ